MTPALRQRKHQSVKAVVNVAVYLHKAGEWDAYCDSITKLLGMADAFNELDDHLFNYTMDCVNALSRFSLDHTAPDFNAWAAREACKALRAAA